MIKNNKYLKLVFIIAISACTNISQSKKALTTVTNPAVVSSTTSTVYSHILKNVSVASVTTSGASTVQITLTTDTSPAGYQPLTGFCGTGTTNPCVCELKWTEVNTSGGITTSYDRTKRVSVTEVQSGLVKCSVDQSIWDQIPSTTVIHFNIVPVSTNTTGLNCQQLDFKKGTSISPSGDFTDDTLTPFLNIKRYACFTNRVTAHEITNAYTEPSVTCPSGSTCPTYQVIMGSQFCSGDASSASSANSGASTKKCMAPRTGPSAQSYYRNFYVRSDENVTNSQNSTYDCPLVAEAIGTVPSTTVPTTGTGSYWPYDSTFSLAKNYSADWSVGVSAASTLLRSSTDGGSTSCVNEVLTNRLAGAPSNGTPNGEPGVATKCIGYAKKPKVDGTCGTITDSNGRVRPLVRLRKYRAIFPPIFSASGQVVATNLAADEVLVADRLVVNAAGVATGAMIYGPKPCNYSWFDHEGVTTRDAPTSVNDPVAPFAATAVPFASGFTGDTILGVNYQAVPGYVSTSKYNYVQGRYQPTNMAGINAKSWSVNPDGQVFPNRDYRGGGVTNANDYSSCSATLPLVNSDAQSLRFLTSNSARSDKVTLGTRDFYLSEIHIQPIDPWTPNYVEDTSFQACAPLPTNYMEPPLQFYKKDNNTIAWCVKAYPTQNPYWTNLNKRVKPSSSSGSTSATTDVVFYPKASLIPGFTSHRNTAAGVANLLDSKNSCTGFNAAQVCALTAATDVASCTTFLNTFCDRKGGDQLCTALKSKPSLNTCDRTVMYDAYRANKYFPLTADDADINSMLSNDLNHDKSFSCQYSVNPDPTKVNAKVPSSGCCGVENGVPILDNILKGPSETSATAVNGAAGHLEPYKVNASPLNNSSTSQIFFCGNPVE